MLPTILVIEHVPHERLGTLEAGLTKSGCLLRHFGVYDAGAPWPRLDDVQGIIAMGGPMSVYEQAAYPWIAKEFTLLRGALKRRLPILGVCLGGQMLAAALGAKVTQASQKEIGWYPLMREPGADGDPLFAPFGQTETVFQWHGDTFALPKGAVRLASSPLCQEQGFRMGDQAWGLQFHVEVTEAMIRAWMRTPVNQAELDRLRGVIDPMAIRRQSPQQVSRLKELAEHVATTFGGIVASSARARTPGRVRTSAA